MAAITIKNLNKVYPNGFVSVKDFSLDVSDGEFIVFYGPSGCGKSTILRMIGGLEDITSGEIYLGDELLNDIPPINRPLAMAFQNYMLYKHLNVFDNISLGLKLRNYPVTVIQDRVQKAAHLLGISELLEKKIRSLNDSERQRVALGRAIVCKPQILLIDEAFSHGDVELAEELIFLIKKIYETTNTTILYVTNDINHAKGFHKKIVFMRDGQLENIQQPDA